LRSDRLPDVDYQLLDILDQRVERELGHVFELLTLASFGPENQGQKSTDDEAPAFDLGVWVNFDVCIIY
jgi:hypothetical protein